MAGKKDKEKNLYDQNLEFKSLDYIMSERFSRYAKYIILQRALPDVRDGLKPVQRRILYSMYDLNLLHNKSFKKSARIVGDVIGKYHPHGDSSIYEALVRMAQDWKMNMPLIEMHGNKGSIDDDPPAAMRYTEARLEKISEEMLKELEKKIVPFAPNFDDSEKEPVVLPAYIPNLLVNGARGIAAGFATEIPPHNLNEILNAAIAKIRKPEIGIRGLKKYILGPDFPTGGIVYGEKGIEESLELGNGKIKISSKYKIETTKKENKIIIEEIPYGVIKSKLIKQIDDLRISSSLHSIKEVRDETDRNGINIAIYLEKEVKIESIISYLLKKTDLQIHYSYNMISINKNSPQLLGVSKMIDCYISFIKKLRRNSLVIDLEKSKTRLEIVLGFIKVANIIDQVIKIIRETEDSKAGVILNLEQKLGFTALQAKAIAEMRLYRLNRTDAQFYLNEKNKLEEKIAEIELLLKNEEFFNSHLIDLLKKLKKEYSVERKTQIESEEKNMISFSREEFVPDEPTYIFLTKDGYIKKVSKKIFTSNEFINFGFKEDDQIIFFNFSNTKNKLLIFSNKGQYITIPIHKLKESKWKSNGQHLSDFASFTSEEKIINAIDIEHFDTNAYLISITKNGIGKKTKIKHFQTQRFSKPSQFMKLKSPKDEVVDVKVSNGLDQIFIISNNFNCWKYSESFIPSVSLRSYGNIVAKLKTNHISAFAIANEKENLIFINSKNKFAQVNFKSLATNSKNNLGNAIFSMVPTKQNLVKKVFRSLNLEVLFSDSKKDIKISFFNQLGTNNDLTFKMLIPKGIPLLFQNKIKINPSEKYFQIDENEEKQTMEEAEKKIHSATKKVEETKIDEKKLDEILKKFNI